MAFVVAPRESITVTVKVKEPLDYGKTKNHQLDVTFKRLTVSEKQDWLAQMKDGGVKDDDVLEDIVLNIKGCTTPDGSPIEFSPELLAQLLDIDYVRKGLTETMMEMLYGKDFMERIKAKN